MTYALIYAPFLISLLLGWCALHALSKEDLSPLSWLLKASLSFGFGLGLSSAIAFLSLLMLGEFNRLFVITFHMLLLAVLGAYGFKHKRFSVKHALPKKEDLLLLLGLGVLCYPVWVLASYFPYGGWDAWSVWNFKAKMIFSGGANWNHLFDPLLWRTSPHYPIFLPLVNAWGWSFIGEPTYLVPLFTAVLFTCLTTITLFTFLRQWTNSYLAALPSILLITLPRYLKLSTSQYADITLSFYLLASVVCFFLATRSKLKTLFILSGIMLGLLSFTKSEGLLSALILMGLCGLHLVSQRKSNAAFLNDLKHLALSFIITAIPALIFKLCLAPSNMTMTNGLTSLEDPATLTRFQIIMAFYGLMLINEKWNALWIALVVGMACGWRRLFQQPAWIIPAFLSCYTLIITAYYFVNTRWDIAWWLSVSLSRILCSILPLVIIWVVMSLWEKEKA